MCGRSVTPGAVLGCGFAPACAAPVAPSLSSCSGIRIVTAGAVGRPLCGQPPGAPAAPMLAAGVRSRAGVGPGATRRRAPACHAGRVRSLRSLRPSRHARLWCCAGASDVRARSTPRIADGADAGSPLVSTRLSGPQPAPPPARWRVPAGGAGPGLRSSAFANPPSGVSAEQPSRRAGAARHAACGGLTAPLTVRCAH